MKIIQCTITTTTEPCSLIHINVDNADYLFIHHDFFAKDITRLVCQIGSHCTPETSPVAQTKRNKVILV